ncbi:hypothetical protein [uncultured Corynebacterium sp.]|uniref:hypothetical protein n=1 Tax=uncultured Corynebacterium sp. TaxID=159447 RepID=UPI002599A3A5|nr:hypothetical protein [uncultured Corynebacterium sp.]
MAPTSHVPTSQAPMPYALSHAAENRSSGREFIEPATGFSLLHTIQLGQSANAATSPTAKVTSAYNGCSVASGTAVMTALPPAVATPAAKKTPQTPHVVQHCEQNLRQELGTITRRVFDIIAGRRRVNDLRRINIDPIIHAAILTLSKNTSLKGVALQSFHASASADGKKVEFLGSCRVGPRVRAFTGTFRRGTAKTRPWIMTAFRVL